MLPGQNGGGYQNSALFGVADALEGSAQGHFRFAKSHIAAEQPVHGGLTLHVLLDFVNAPELVIGFVVGEMGFKVPLPLGVFGESVSLGFHPLSIEFDQLLGHVPHCGTNPGFGFLPLGAAQTVELDAGIFPGADVLGHHVQLGHRHIQHIVFGVLHLDIIFDDPVHIDFVDALEDADTVGNVYHIIPGGQLREAVDFLGVFVPLLPFGPGSGSQLSVADNAQPRVGEFHACGKGTGQYRNGALGYGFRVFQKRGGELGGLQIGGNRPGGALAACQHHTAVPVVEHGL